MNKQNLLFLALVSALGFSLEAREWRTPSPLSYGYAYSHFPFMPPIDVNECNRCWWFDMINPWAAAEFRHANQAFINDDSTKRRDLSSLFFNRSVFTLADIVTPGSVNPLVPLAGIITLSPTFDYTEHTAWFGLNLEKHFGCEEQWHVGLRLRIPFRDIKTQLDSCCDLESNINNLFVEQNELVCNEDTPATRSFINNAFAYRLDLLSALPLAVNGTTKFVNYRDPANNNNVSMAAENVTRLLAPLTQPPVQVISRPDGTAPAAPFTLRITDGGATTDCPVNAQSAVTSLPPLAADGSGLAANLRAVFQSDINYTPLSANVVNQSKLWVVPSGDGVPANNFDIVESARAIQAAFHTVINSPNTSIVNFLATSTGISFQTQRTSGPGDFFTEIYVHRDFCGCWGDWFAEGIFGVVFPTAKRDKFPNLLLLVPKGNNRHYELKIGGFLGWQPTDWLAIKVDGFYNWALRRKERVAASFAGATVKNIGPTVDARVSWEYFVGDVDFTFIVPCLCPELGFDVGYQPYVKRRDKISFVDTTATDLLGNVNTLDASVLQSRTKQVAHTIKGEIFYQACSWQLFGGFNRAVAGKNAANFADWYLGLEVYF